MMRSLYAGVSGLKVHQTKMDVIGNNIANVNTVGFKKSRVTFQEMLNQTLRGASSPQGGRGGTNPMQIGLGVTLGSIDVIHSPGSPQSTGRTLDMAIEGEGYFVVGQGAQRFYTRAGNFDFDYSYNLVNPNGYYVQGWVADSKTLQLETGDLSKITNINLGELASKTINRATSNIEIGKNLDSRIVASGVETYTYSLSNDEITNFNPLDPETYLRIKLDSAVFNNEFTINGIDYATMLTNSNAWEFNPVTGELIIKDLDVFNLTSAGDFDINYRKADHITPIKIYDSQGNSHEAVVSYYKSADNTWLANVTIDGELVQLNSSPGTEFIHQIEFDEEFKIISGLTLKFTYNNSIFGPVVDPLDITIDLSGLTQVAMDTTALGLSQDGFEPGSLESISVNTSGTIVGTFSNGQSIDLAQVAIATFRNPAGLLKVGNTLFQVSKNSGEPQLGIPGVDDKGVIKPETLEMSNVDLSEEFVEMITTQRGFQANSRIITTSDEMLQELVNLRR